MALHWIHSEGSYKRFVANMVRMVIEKNFINWRPVRINDNAADIGSRGETSEPSMIQWLNVPSWLSEKSHWPDEISIASREESEKEAKLTKDVLAVSISWIHYSINSLSGKQSDFQISKELQKQEDRSQRGDSNDCRNRESHQILRN